MDIFLTRKTLFVRQLTMEFEELKSISLEALDNKLYFHEPRQAIAKKNKFKSQQVDAKFIRNKINRSKEKNYKSYPDRNFKSRTLHEIKVEGWYLKFYFEDQSLYFISVHKLN